MNRRLSSPSLLAAKPRRRKRIGEVAGSTAAECAAVWCCCPCAAVSVLFLALYRVPAGLCRRVHRKRSKKSGQSDGLLLQRKGGPIGPGFGPTLDEVKLDDDVADSDHDDEEIWVRFSASGFWRSPSQRDRDV